MKNWFTLLTIFACIGLNTSLNGQAQKNPKRFYIENPAKTSVRMTFKLLNNLVVLPVFVNNSDTLNFILDSGISNTIITDQALADKLNMVYLREIQMYGFGSDNALTAKHSTENNIRMSGILGQHQDILVIPDPDIDFSRLLGIKIHGLLGYSLFRDFIIDINYDNKTIVFHAPRTYNYKFKKKSVTIPISLIETKPFITTKIIQEDSSIVECRFLIDSGASFALWLDLNSSRNIKIPERNEMLYLGTGFGGAVYGKVGRILEFGEGPIKLKNVIASFSDSSNSFPGKFSDKRNGTIGADILSRYNVIFDYRNNKITLRPNSKFKDPFLVNMSGMEICCPTPGENLYSISEICHNSPAYNAGLRRDDQVILINQQELSKLSLTEVHAILTRKQGRKMTVQYLRNGKINMTTLVMNRSI
ncbi:MAG: PDZ domain-containing protein [Chloroflexia bacterium]|nr:PDZ domain-containing protein [Chloroflexia bacterium]